MKINLRTPEGMGRKHKVQFCSQTLTLAKILSSLQRNKAKISSLRNPSVDFHRPLHMGNNIKETFSKLVGVYHKNKRKVLKYIPDFCILQDNNFFNGISFIHIFISERYIVIVLTYGVKCDIFNICIKCALFRSE